ncbi:olfactory receptor 1M1-like [Discoglossus pictus]
MCKNGTSNNEFLLLGFNSHTKFKTLLFFLFLVIYVIILTGNILIVALVSTSHHFNLPMYAFLKNLALADILFTTNIIPNMLSVIWSEGGTISLTGCFSQYYFHSMAIFAQSLILTVMSFDRYLAISHPLHYTLIMNQNLCFHLIFWSWAFGFIIIPSEIILLSQLTFCGSNIIDHFFCDIAPVLQLSSSDTSVVKWEDFVFSILVIFIPFVFVIVSYGCIFMTIMKINTTDGRQKAFSTCSSHLVTVCMYYGTLITIYMVPAGGNISAYNKFTSLLYTVLTPLINPIIYSLRNQEIKRCLKKLIC